MSPTYLEVTSAWCLQAAAYEACRVFRDRLVNAEQVARFDSILADTLRKHWRVNPDLTSSVFATIGSAASQVKSGKAFLFSTANLHPVDNRPTRLLPIQPTHVSCQTPAHAQSGCKLSSCMRSNIAETTEAGRLLAVKYFVGLAVSAGTTGHAAQLYMSNWSNADYLQLVTEKLTAFEREHTQLSMVLFDQVSVNTWH